MGNRKLRGIYNGKIILAVMAAVIILAMVLFSIVLGTIFFQNDSNKDAVRLGDEQEAEYDLSKKVSEDKMVFAVSEGKATFKGLSSDPNSNETSLIIPTEYNGNPVTRIDVLDTNSQGYVRAITAVVVPDSVTYIQPAALGPFVSLRYVSLPFIGQQRGAQYDYDSPFASVFATRYAEKNDAITNAYSNTVNSVLLSNADNICPWYKGNDVDGTADYFYSMPKYLHYVVITDETDAPERPFFGIESVKSIRLEKISNLISDYASSGMSTFHSCTALEEVYLPDSLHDLTQYMFGKCVSLKEVTIQDGITGLPIYLFTECSGLVTVNLPSTIKNISEGAFYQCTSLVNINHYSSDSNRTPTVTTGFNLPNSVTTIGPRAFYECAFTSVRMNNLTSLTTIEGEAFRGCQDIVDMSLPFIGRSQGSTGKFGVFGYIFGTITGGTIQVYGDENSDQGSYNIPSSLKSITITNETYVERGALSNFDYVETIVLNDGITEIHEAALEKCSALKDLTVPFVGNSLSQGGNAVYYTIFGKSGKSGTDTPTSDIQYYVPVNLTNYTVTNQPTIYAGALHHFPSLENLTISNKTTTLDQNILRDNGNLTSITLPFVGWTRGERSVSIYTEWWLTQRRKNSVSWIFSTSKSQASEYGNTTMQYYDSYIAYIPNKLRSITITDETVIGTWSFRGFKSITSLTIANKPSYIAEACAYDCGDLTTLDLPYIGCNVNDGGSSGRQYSLGWIFGTSNYTNSYVAYEHDYYRLPKKLSTVTIRDYTNTVGSYAFANASSLVTVKLKGEIQNVYSHAFENCSNLAHLESNKAKYTTVSDYAFSNCVKLALLYEEDNQESFIPATVVNIGANAFQGTAISYVDLYRFKNIGSYAFKNCLNLTEVDIPSVDDPNTILETLGEGVFAGCAYITTVTLGDNTARKALFKDCSSIQNVSLQAATVDLKVIPDEMFSGCKSLTTINVRNDTTAIGASAFKDCKSLADFTISSNIVTIGSNAFEGCTKLKYMTIPRNVKTIYSNGWINCNDDFYFYVYDPESDWPTTWDKEWNCNYPVYIIGQIDETIFEYTYIAELKGYIITNVVGNNQLSGQVQLPTKHNGVKIVGLGAGALDDQFGISSIILGVYTRVIGAGALANGQLMKVYIDVDSTSDQLNQLPNGFEDIKIPGNEKNWLSYGVVYYGQYWDYSGSQALVPTLLASKLETKVSDQEGSAFMYYNGLEHKPPVEEIKANGVVVSTGSSYSKTALETAYIDIPLDLFDYTYSNNVAATTETSKASVRGTINGTRLTAYNAEPAHAALVDKLYITGSFVDYFDINKKEIHLFPNGMPDPIVKDYGEVWEFDSWGNTFVGELNTPEYVNFKFSGTLTTYSRNAGTYTTDDKIENLGFRWKQSAKVTLYGVDVTKNFDILINPEGGEEGRYYLTVIIRPLDVIVNWTGGSYNQTNEYYLWPYTGNDIVPTANAIPIKGGEPLNIISAEAANPDDPGKTPTYFVKEGVETITPGTYERTAKAKLKDGYNQNYRLLEYNTTTQQYEEVNSYTTVQYRVKPAVINITIDDEYYKIKPYEQYWSMTEWSNMYVYYETTVKTRTGVDTFKDDKYGSTYSVSGINEGTIFEGKLVTIDDAATTHDWNQSEIVWEPIPVTISGVNYNLDWHIYRYEDPNTKAVKIEENEYYDVVVNARVKIVHNHFNIKYYVDAVSDENLIPDEDVHEVYNTKGEVELLNITYRTEGDTHILIAHVEDGIESDSLEYLYAGEPSNHNPLQFKEIRKDNEWYAVAVNITRARFVTYYRNIHLFVIESDIIIEPFDKEYDGEPVNPSYVEDDVQDPYYGVVKYPSVKRISSPTHDNLAIKQYKSLNFTYYLRSDTNRTTPIAAPSDVGEYVVHMEAQASVYFNALNKWVDFDITKRVIEIDVRKPGGDYLKEKYYDSYVHAVQLVLDNSMNNKILPTDEFTGTLKTVSAEPGVYNAESKETTYWTWSPAWRVYNSITKEDVSSSYTVKLIGSFEIKNRVIDYDSDDAKNLNNEYNIPFDGFPYSIYVKVNEPVDNYTIYYTTDIVNYASQDGDGIKWSIVNPSYTTPIDIDVYFKIVAPYYDTVYDHQKVKIIKREIDYVNPKDDVENYVLTETPDSTGGYKIKYDSFDHTIEIEINDPYFAKVTYSIDGVNYREQPYTYNDIGRYRIFYRIEAENYTTVEDSCWYWITDIDLTDVEAGKDYNVTGFNGDYDGKIHLPAVEIVEGGKMNLEQTKWYYRLSNDEPWRLSLSLTEAGEYTVYVKITCPGFKVVQTTSTVIINKLNFNDIIVESYIGTFDNKKHSLVITIPDKYEMVDYTIYYSLNADSVDYDIGWSETPIMFKNAAASATLVYLKIEGPNYITRFVSNKSVFIQASVDDVIAKEECYEYQYQGNALEVSQIRQMFATKGAFNEETQTFEKVDLVHDGEIIVKYYTAEAVYYPEYQKYMYFNDSNKTNPAEQGKLSFVKDLGYYFVKVTFVGTNNCATKEVSGYLQIVPRELYVIYDEEVEYTGYKITPVFKFSVEEPKEEVPQDPEQEQQEQEETTEEEEEYDINKPPVVEVVVDKDLEIGYKLIAAPDDATQMLELGTYTYSLALYPNTGNYVLKVDEVDIEVIPHKIDIYLRESMNYNPPQVWKKTDGWYTHTDEEHPENVLIVSSGALDGHKLKISMETSSYEHQAYVYVENPAPGQGNYIIISYDVIKVDANQDPILDENQQEISVLKYYSFTFDVKVKIVYGAFNHTFEDIEIEYDGKKHYPMVTLNSEDIQNAVIEYSLQDPGEDLDKGAWFRQLPGEDRVSETKIYIRVTSNNYEPLYTSIMFKIKPADLKFVVDEFDETYSDEDYTITYTAKNSSGNAVEGLPEPFSILYYSADEFEGDEIKEAYNKDAEFSTLYKSGLTCMHNAGKYFVVIYYKKADNWNKSFTISTVTLKRRGIHLSLPNSVVKTTNYNGNAVVVYLTGATYKYDDLVSGHVILDAIHSIKTNSANANKDGEVYDNTMMEFNSMFIYDEMNRKANLAANYYPIVTSEIAIKINRISFTFDLVGGKFPYAADPGDETGIKLAQPIIHTPADYNPKLYFDNKPHFEYFAVEEDANGNYIPDYSTPLGIDDQYNVGIYYVRVKFDQGTNYNAYTNSDKGAVVEITPLEVRVVWGELTTTFNNEYQAPEVYYKNVLNDDVELTPVLESLATHEVLLDVNGYATGALLAGSYKARPQFKATDKTSMNYTFTSSTLEAFYTIDPIIYTIEVGEEVYNPDTNWYREYKPEDISEDFLSGVGFENLGLGGDTVVKLGTTGSSSGLYQAPTGLEWQPYKILKKDVSSDIDITGSIVLNVEGWVHIYKDEICVEIDEKKLTIVYDTYAHTIDEAITFVDPKKGDCTIQYKLEGGTWSSISPTCTNVGEYNIYMTISYSYYNEYNELVSYPDLEINRVLTIKQHTSTISVLTPLDRVYNGDAVDPEDLALEFTANGSRANLVFRFFECDDNNILQSDPDAEITDETPTDEESSLSPNFRPRNVGHYALRITNDLDSDTSNYSKLEEWYYFEITRRVAYLKVDDEKEMYLGETSTYTRTNATPTGDTLTYMNLCNHDLMKFTIQSTSAKKRINQKVTKTFEYEEPEDAKSPVVYYLDNDHYFSLTYSIKDNQGKDNTSNYILKVTGTIFIRYPYLDYTLKEVQEFEYDKKDHCGEITFNGSYPGIKQSYTYLQTTADNISGIYFSDPDEYPVSYRLDYEDHGYEVAEGVFTIVISHRARLIDENKSKNFSKDYDGEAVTIPDYLGRGLIVDQTAATGLSDNYNASDVTCIFQRYGTNGVTNSIKDAGRYLYTITIPKSAYYSETKIEGEFQIYQSELRITGSYSTGYNGNTVLYNYVSSTDNNFELAKIDNGLPDNSEEALAEIANIEVTLNFETKYPDVNDYWTGNTTLLIAGDYIIRNTAGEDFTKNYFLSFDAKITITEGDMVVEADDVIAEYDGLIHLPQVRMVSPSSAPTRIAYSLDGTHFDEGTVGIPTINSDGYTLFVRVEKTNYKTQTIQVKVTITKIKTTIALPDMSKVYNGAEVLWPTPENIDTNTTEVDSKYWKISYEKLETIQVGDSTIEQWGDMGASRPIDIGRYKLKLEIPVVDPNDPDHILSNVYTGGSAEREFEITPVSLVLTWNSTSFTYTGKKQVPTFMVTKTSDPYTPVDYVVPVVNVTTNTDLETLVDPIDIGVYIATASIPQTKNYVIEEKYTKTTFSIQQKTLKVYANKHVTYNGKAFTMNYQSGDHQYTLTGLCDDHFVYPSPLSTEYANTDKYVAKGTLITGVVEKVIENDVETNIVRPGFKWDNGKLQVVDQQGNLVIDNYAIEYDVTFEIDLSEIDYELEEYEAEYDGLWHGIKVTVNNVAESTITYAFKEDGSVPADSDYQNSPFIFKDVAYDVVDPAHPAVIRWVYFKIHIDNYEDITKKGKVFIQKKKVNVALASTATLSKIYDGDNIANPEVTYDGKDENPRFVYYTYYRYRDKDLGELETNPTTLTSDVGYYRLFISLADGASQNYIGGTKEVDFEIVPRDITIAIRDANGKIIPQTTTYNGNLWGLSITAENFNSYVSGLAKSTEVVTATVKTTSVIARKYNKESDFEIMNLAITRSDIGNVTSNYRAHVDMNVEIIPATIVYDAGEEGKAWIFYYNGYTHEFKVDVKAPEDGATVYYWTDADPTKRTTPYTQKRRGTTTVYFQIIADNYNPISIDSRQVQVIGISTDVNDNNPLIYDDSKVYDTKPYMYNEDVTQNHPRIVTPSTGDQVVTYYKKGVETPIVSITYKADGTTTASEADLNKVPKDAGEYLFDLYVKAEEGEDAVYEQIDLDNKVPFRINQLDREVIWSDLTQTYIGTPTQGTELVPTAIYLDYDGNEVALQVLSPQSNANLAGYTVTAVPSGSDANYNLSNTSATFVIKPIEVEELNLQSGRKFKYREERTYRKLVPIYGEGEDADKIVDYDEINEPYAFGDAITILDVQGNEYFIDENGNITDVKDTNGDSIIDDLPNVGLYKITIVGDGQVFSQTQKQFVVSLKNTTNYVWKAAQNSNSLNTEYEVIPFDIDDTTDDIEVQITLPSYVLVSDEPVKPQVTATLIMIKDSERIELRDLTNQEYSVGYQNNDKVTKDAIANVLGFGNFYFQASHKFEIRDEDPDRFELMDDATVKFIKYVKSETNSGIQFAITTDNSDTGDNPAKEIGEEEIYLGRLHQSQTIADVMKQFVRFDTSPKLFKVWDNNGNMVDPNKYATMAARTGLTIKLYAKESDANADEDARSRAKCVDYVRTVLYGDLTSDGVINAADNAAIKKVLLGMESYDSLGVLYLAGLIGDIVRINAQASAAMKKFLIDKQLNDFNANYLVNIET